VSNFKQTSTINISTPYMSSGVTAHELKLLGYNVNAQQPNYVEVQGTLEDCMNLCLQLRTASRVLFKLFDFDAINPDKLYDGIRKYDWEKWLEPDGYFSVQSFTQNDAVNNTLFTNLRIKDAIADRYNERFGRRPDSGPSKDGVIVFVHWVKNHAVVYIDTSGDSLARHGYRKIPLQAPLQENLAATMVMSTVWKPFDHFVNPMCGSGTLAIEAALIKIGKPPGLIKKNFAFRYIKGYDAMVWERMVTLAEGRITTKPFQSKIIATDISRDAVNAAKINAKLAGVDHLIKFDVATLEDTFVPTDNIGGVVIMNPPYGDRLGEEQRLEGLYGRIGDFMKQSCKGYFGYVFTGTADLAKKIGLKPKRRMVFYNAKIECRLLEFELYSGTRKVKPAKEDEANVDE
jgi:putative N6-adenine-specific DNA methylase